MPTMRYSEQMIASKVLGPGSEVVIRRHGQQGCLMRRRVSTEPLVGDLVFQRYDWKRMIGGLGKPTS